MSEEIRLLMEKAGESLQAAEILKKEGYPDFSASRAYEGRVPDQLVLNKKIESMTRWRSENGPAHRLRLYGLAYELTDMLSGQAAAVRGLKLWGGYELRILAG